MPAAGRGLKGYMVVLELEVDFGRGKPDLWPDSGGPEGREFTTGDDEC